MPARRDRAPEERQPDADVEVPRRARRGPGRYAEVELRGRCARAQDPRELAQAGREVVQISEEVGAGQAVERPGLEGKLLRRRLDQPHALRLTGEQDASPRSVEHPVALVGADDAASLL